MQLIISKSAKTKTYQPLVNKTMWSTVRDDLKQFTDEASIMRDIFACDHVRNDCKQIDYSKSPQWS